MVIGSANNPYFSWSYGRLLTCDDSQNKVETMSQENYNRLMSIVQQELRILDQVDDDYLDNKLYLVRSLMMITEKIKLSPKNITLVGQVFDD